MRILERTRETKETNITAVLTFPDTFPRTGTAPALSINSGVPFFDHMLTAFSYHGGFGLTVTCEGDTAVDDHHTVEDVGIVLGSLFRQVVQNYGPVLRFGHAIIPMDDSLGEVVVDACGRSFLSWNVTFPQERAGQFDLHLVREFFTAFASEAKINLHLISRYGINGHHLAEALFKASGRALAQAFVPAGTILSTKGSLE
jgi:imidazoleglycerol-phosphate dehydratase